MLYQFSGLGPDRGAKVKWGVPLDFHTRVYQLKGVGPGGMRVRLSMVGVLGVVE